MHLAIAAALAQVAPAVGQIVGPVVEFHAEGGHNWYQVSDDFYRMNEYGGVSADDIVEVCERWGENCEPGTTIDRNNDGVIDVHDLLEVMSGRPGPVYTIPEGWTWEEGCILRPPPDNPLAGAFNSASWTNGTVYYEYDANVSGANQTRFETAISRWEAVANLNFVVRTNEPNWIHVQQATFNSSTSIGMQGGQQFINLNVWNTFTVEHEICHALGFYHHHTRADRNNFVTINWANICSCCGSGSADCTGNFTIRGDAGPFGSTDYGPYDFDSVMHYGACAWTNCAAGVCNSGNASCRTITVNPPFDTDWQANIGQRTHLSDLDQIAMSMLYPFNNWEFVDGSWGGTENGTFFEPHNTVGEGVTDVPVNGTVIIQPGTYTEPGVYDKDMMWRAPIGGVLIQ